MLKIYTVTENVYNLFHNLFCQIKDLLKKSGYESQNIKVDNVDFRMLCGWMIDMQYCNICSSIKGYDMKEIVLQ